MILTNAQLQVKLDNLHTNKLKPVVICWPGENGEPDDIFDTVPVFTDGKTLIFKRPSD